MLRKILAWSIPALFISCLSAQACQIRYGVTVAEQDKKEFKADWPNSPLHKALAQGSQCEVVLDIYPSDKALYRAVVHKKVDLAYLRDFTFYLAQKKNPSLQPLAVTLSSGLEAGEPAAYYKAYIITLAGNGINTVEDLNGKKLGVRDEVSTSGHIVPQDYFDQNNLKVSPEFLGTDKALFAALHAKKVDAIATWDWTVNRNKGQTVHILKTFEQLPNPPLVGTHTFKASTRTGIQQALLQVQIDDKTQPIQGYVAVPPKMYDALDKIYARYCSNHAKDCHW